jgi:hypothetical protein
LLAIIAAIVIAIGLTSTAAKAGLIAATESPGFAAMSPGDLDKVAFDTPAAAEMQAAPASYQPAVIATPALVVTAGTPSDVALHPYLEEEQVFAPGSSTWLDAAVRGRTMSWRGAAVRCSASETAATRSALDGTWHRLMTPSLQPVTTDTGTWLSLAGACA